jgi:hypothetical protein
MKLRTGFVSNSSSSSFTLFDNGTIAEVEVDNYIYIVRSHTKKIVNKHMLQWDDYYSRIAAGRDDIYRFDHVICKLKLCDEFK